MGEPLFPRSSESRLPPAIGGRDAAAGPLASVVAEDQPLYAAAQALLLKPTELSSEEWALMQRHAEEGARIIDRLGFLGDAVPAIRHHHDRWDGAGYPDGLAGEEIPLGARIIHVAGALDSMFTNRVYRAARPAGEALDELRPRRRQPVPPDGRGARAPPRERGDRLAGQRAAARRGGFLASSAAARLARRPACSHTSDEPT